MATLFSAANGLQCAPIPKHLHHGTQGAGIPPLTTPFRKLSIDASITG